MRDYVITSKFHHQTSLVSRIIRICTVGGWVGILFHSAASGIPLQFQNEA